MSTKKTVRNSHRIGLMATASTISSEAADLMDLIGARLGNYTREGRIEIIGEKIGLSPSQARRIALRRRKSIPALVMDRLRALYHETCEALDESARQKIEANDAASEKRRNERSCVDGECDGPLRGLGEREGEGDAHADADEVND